MEGRFASIGGLRTHYIREGAGPALLLLHGQTPGSCLETEWFKTIPHFAAAGRTVVAFDQPGFGRTDNPTDFSMAARIAHARAFVDAMGFERYAAWGCSMGSYIAAEMAKTDRRLARMILMPSSVLPPPSSSGPTAEGTAIAAAFREYAPSQKSARHLLELIFARRENISDAHVERFLEMSSGKNYEAKQQRLEQPRPPEIHGTLSDVRIPALMLWGDLDPGAPPERALALLAALPGAELHFLRGHKHWPHLEAPERVNQLVQEFLHAPFSVPA